MFYTDHIFFHKNFHVVITGYCRSSAGNVLVQRGDYKILKQDDQDIIPSELSAVIHPGMTVEMSIVIRQQTQEDAEHTCPRCNYANRKVLTNSGWIHW